MFFLLKLLDDQFTASSLAQALGITQTQSLLWNHVYKKFMELVGPVAAQRKLDAMKNKSFVHLDPLLKAKACHCFVRDSIKCPSSVEAPLFNVDV